MKIALGAKVKLGFINGSCAMPAENDAEYVDWKRSDCMVISWLLNSISKDIVDAFLLMQFLMDLDENYDHIRNQILLMEPLPSVNKPYSMVLRVEKQREVHMLFDQEENNSMMVRGQGISKPSGRQQSELREQKKKNIPNPLANTVEERLESDDGSKHPTDWKETVNVTIQRELQKLMKGRGSGEENALNYAHVMDFAGINPILALNSVDSMKSCN
ncbi:UNVERIFIED_CONTAM: hypothetical protein Slati_3014800 [Sesamum latifolium]|uniref:Retrotransposon protein n=1 Tax=Sesamum latifolium TaxID=2727402 RepID=A0AAW2VJI1_9LAMI